MTTMKSFMLDEKQLEEIIEFAGPNGEMAHRFIYHVLSMIRPRRHATIDRKHEIHE